MPLLFFFEPPVFLRLDFFPRAFPPPLLALPRAFEADDFDFFAAFFGAALFLPRLFAAALAGFFALAATFFTAFLTFLAVDAPELFELAARPTIPPITPPTTVPTGPAILPRTAPVAIPAVCFEIGGIWMSLGDELEELSVDC